MRFALRAMGAAREVSRQQIERSAEFVRSAQMGAALDLPGGLRWLAGRDLCRLERASSASDSRC